MTIEGLNGGVCVICLTYNHSSFIIDTLDSFTKQETSFPYVCVIIDDASTDGEEEIIHNYVLDNFIVYDNELIKSETDDFTMQLVRHSSNKNCFFAIYNLKYNHYSIGKNKLPYIADFTYNAKYHAYCEGDDFWVDPLKLQKQVDYMNSTADCVLCYTNFKVVDQNNLPINNRYTPIVCHSGEVFDKLLKTNFVQTATILIRAEASNLANELCIQRGAKYDYGLFLELSMMGKFYYLNEITTSYRVCLESASHSKSLIREIQFALDTRREKMIYSHLKNPDRNYLLELWGKMELISKVTVKHYLRNYLKYKY